MTGMQRPLQKIIELARPSWDQSTERDAVRQNLNRVTMCGTGALGWEVYSSDVETKLVPHTCKSKACPTCGSRATKQWQREAAARLPDVPFVGLVFSMPNVFWPIFEAHRHLEHDLPALAAAVIQQFVWNNYRLRIYVIAVQHTFGGLLNHYPHQHLMISAGGLDPSRPLWVKSYPLDLEEIKRLWNFAISSYLWKAYRGGLLTNCQLPEDFEGVIDEQQQLYWHVHINRQMSKKHFVEYAGRYVRRLPISQQNILQVSEHEVVYRAKDTRTGTLEEERCAPAELIAKLASHIQDRYQHSMRSFGLFSPRTIRQMSAGVFALLGQRPRPKPQRESWAFAMRKYFGVDPLLDSFGNRMRWTGRRNPL